MIRLLHMLVSTLHLTVYCIAASFTSCILYFLTEQVLHGSKQQQISVNSQLLLDTWHCLLAVLL